MIKESKDKLLSLIRNGEKITLGQQLKLTFSLSIPAIISQSAFMIMQYIDAAMVGRLGTDDAAAISLVTTTIWLITGFNMALTSGFSVQIAHLVGAKDFAKAKRTVKQGVFSMFVFSLFPTILTLTAAPYIPIWLGGSPEVVKSASKYLFITGLFIPVCALEWMAGAMLQAGGNMKIPSILYSMMCVLDIFFNYIFIFRAGMGVSGAALGTGLAELFVCVAMISYLLIFSKELNIKNDKSSYIPDKQCIKNALGITSPMWLQNIIMRGAHIVSTIIIAPLGAVSIAANGFAIIAESFCYMPGFGIQDAATTLTGQCLGAQRKDLAKRFAFITCSASSVIMTVCGIIMFVFAHELMGILTDKSEVMALGAKVLRIEAFAETMFGLSIAAYGVCVGAGDTMIPSIYNFFTMWGIRIITAFFLTPKLGLAGFWIGMCIDLNVRGALFLFRMKRGKWMNKKFSFDDKD